MRVGASLRASRCRPGSSPSSSCAACSSPQWLRAWRHKARSTCGPVACCWAWRCGSGFPIVLWTGALIHENTPLRLAAIHAGDWLVQLLVVAVIVSVWQ